MSLKSIELPPVLVAPQGYFATKQVPLGCTALSEDTKTTKGISHRRS